MASVLTLTAFGLVIAGTEPLFTVTLSLGVIVFGVSLLAVLQISVINNFRRTADSVSTTV